MATFDHKIDNEVVEREAKKGEIPVEGYVEEVLQVHHSMGGGELRALTLQIIAPLQ